LEKALLAQQLSWGNAVFLRVFKEESQLELWVKGKHAFVLFKTYPICYFSGTLGPKMREGDFQVPEGFYTIRPQAMNPWSQFHLSFNIGYPNSFDRAHNRTGSLIMVHGNCVSTGCLAMTDPAIEEIYALVEAALMAGQTSVPIHLFPFRMTPTQMRAHRNHPAHSFWQDLKMGYDRFEPDYLIPKIRVQGKRYTFP
jgi:murein L,D-transpeptidase YafK